MSKESVASIAAALLFSAGVYCGWVFCDIRYQWKKFRGKP